MEAEGVDEVGCWDVGVVVGVGGVVGGIVGGVVASKAGGVFADVFNDYVVSPVAKWFGG